MAVNARTSKHCLCSLAVCNHPQQAQGRSCCTLILSFTFHGENRMSCEIYHYIVNPCRGLYIIHFSRRNDRSGKTGDIFISRIVEQAISIQHLSRHNHLEQSEYASSLRKTSRHTSSSQARNPFSSPHQHLTKARMSLQFWLHYAAPVIGLYFLAQGIFTFYRPAQAATAFGIATSTTNGEAMAFIRYYGTRNMALGTAILALFFARRYREMGIVIMCVNVATIFDASVVWIDVDGRRSSMWPSIAMCAFLAVVWGANLGMYPW